MSPAAVNPVDFALTPTQLSKVPNREYSDRDYDEKWNGKTVNITQPGNSSTRDYISTWGKVKN